MAAPRLPFLWPMLFRSSEAYTPAVRTARAVRSKRTLHVSTRRKQHESITQRYGPANEPPPHLGVGEQAKLPRIGEKLQKDGEHEARADRVEAAKPEQDQRTEPATVDGSVAKAKPAGADTKPDSTESRPPEAMDGKSTESLLDSIPGPAEQQRQEQQDSSSSASKAPEDDHPTLSFEEHSPPIRAPHMEPPRHVHHFDTYGLVKRLTDAGWNDAQAVTIMKAVRLMLADNMDLAREALVSKSMVENETYLFRAACAELKTEVTSRRRAEQEKMRAERTQLQHEVDILSQRLGQESGVLKDDLKGMFDDRKMAVRNEQRNMESKVQELNYKITVSLQADARSEVEGLRWFLTRRVIIALATVVVMVIGSLRLASNAAHQRELEAKRLANMRSGGTQTDSGSGQYDGGSGSSGDASRGKGTGGEILVQDGDNPAFVSLG
ncbi:hypothetical protein LTR36_000060 [Oleoguttula mirabilis]|uniref:MOZ protein represents a chromatin-associated acetyltransferase n=1 Tax=Oleoguttula mirabilis TaxID=1507867 RepID=A0AAV9JY15_9PEZI|nr:hypothetical protein LTR36_000060 [Oleoguttula mirabilis]